MSWSYNTLSYFIQVPFHQILGKFNGQYEKEYKTHKDSTLKRFELTRLPPYIIVYVKVITLLIRQHAMYLLAICKVSFFFWRIAQAIPVYRLAISVVSQHLV